MVIIGVQGQGFQGCSPAPYCTYIARALLSQIRSKILIGTLHVLFARIANFHVHT